MWRYWMLTVAGLLVAPAVQAEVRSFSIDQLKRVSSTHVPGAPARGDQASAADLPPAVPYAGTIGRIQMPELPQPVRNAPKMSNSVQAASVTQGIKAAVVPVATQTVSATMLSQIDAGRCRTALRLSAEVALEAYQRKTSASYMAIVAAATMADDVVAQGGIPNLAAYKDATRDLPWFGPLKEQIQQTGAGVELACTPIGGVGNGGSSRKPSEK